MQPKQIVIGGPTIGININNSKAVVRAGPHAEVGEAKPNSFTLPVLSLKQFLINIRHSRWNVTKIGERQYFDKKSWNPYKRLRQWRFTKIALTI